MTVDHVLDAESIRAGLAAAGAAPGLRIEVVAEIDSTNAELLRRSSAMAEDTLLLARSQRAGRGRQGRVWQSPPDANLYLSYGCRMARSPRELGGLSLVVGLACADALRELGFDHVGLKWPNDLLARQRKLGGILVELGADLVVIGIGINLRMPATQAGIDQPWIDLAALASPPSHLGLTVAIMRHLLPMLAQFATSGFAPFAARWETYDVLAGQAVRVLSGDATIEGRACGVAPDGALRLATADGERRFHSAEVSLRPA